VAKVRFELGQEAADRIEVHVPAGASVYCDRELVSEALKEVLVNALTFSPPGVTVRLSAVEAPGQRIRFEVADRGTGIPEHLLENGLEAFRPGPGGAKPSMGLGFGLPAVETIVQRHGGHLGVMSEPGIGSEFFLSFPAGREQAGALPTKHGAGVARSKIPDRQKASVSGLQA
jgi:signal transduction histidine kinase